MNTSVEHLLDVQTNVTQTRARVRCDLLHLGALATRLDHLTLFLVLIPLPPLVTRTDLRLSCNLLRVLGSLGLATTMFLMRSLGHIGVVGQELLRVLARELILKALTGSPDRIDHIAARLILALLALLKLYEALSRRKLWAVALHLLKSPLRLGLTFNQVGLCAPLLCL